MKLKVMTGNLSCDKFIEVYGLPKLGPASSLKPCRVAFHLSHGTTFPCVRLQINLSKNVRSSNAMHVPEKLYPMCGGLENHRFFPKIFNACFFKNHRLYVYTPED